MLQSYIPANVIINSGGSRIPRRGGGHSLSLVQKPIIWQDFCRKLHENKRNLSEVGDARP